ncbi:MAG: FAD-binding protein [Acidobacteriota bacterium]|nr:FAD-binding protein [Acidobacteriota bacterium]
MTLYARDVADVQEALQPGTRLLPRGGGSKTGLSAGVEGAQVLDVSALTGVVEHLPAEFTVTVAAATPVVEVEELLGQSGQYLPFDPLLVAGGATMGGSVAAGVSGPGRVRYGGIRDFVLGVTVVDGTGAEIRGGGKVVKNAAGFDLPKLMVGSLGSLGVMTELTFKVFPAPEARLTVRAQAGSLRSALELAAVLYRSPVQFDALDLDRAGTLWARISGRRAALAPRAERLLTMLEGGESLEESEAEAIWSEGRELAWIGEEAAAVRVPLTPSRIEGLERSLPKECRLRVSGGGQMVWVGWPAMAGGIGPLDALLEKIDLGGLRVLGGSGPRLIGHRASRAAVARVRGALDPYTRLAEAC